MVRLLRAFFLALAIASLHPASPLSAQQPAQVQDATATPAGPRRAPVLRPVEVRLKSENAAPVRYKDTTVITISTLGLVLILVLLIVLIA